MVKYITNPMEKRLGAPTPCPKCGGMNPSGFYDVERCVWCGKYGIMRGITSLDLKNVKKSTMGPK
jgi:hypothetical protein